MAVRSPMTKRETSAENNWLSEATLPDANAKAKAKVKVKAKAKPAKVPAGVLLITQVLDSFEDFDKSQKR